MKVFVLDYRDDGTTVIHEGTVRDNAQLSRYSCPHDHKENVLVPDGRILTYRYSDIYLTHEGAEARVKYNQGHETEWGPL